MNLTMISYRRELHQRAQGGDTAALEALYRSMLPLLKARVRRVLAGRRTLWRGWYGPEDLRQDVYLVFHRFVMSSDPVVPLYRLLAGAFARALREHLRRCGPLRRPDSGLDAAYDEDQPAPPVTDDSSPVLIKEELSPIMGEDDWPDYERSGYAAAFAADLLAALPTPGDRQLIALALAGYTAAEAAAQLGLSLAALRYQRRRLRSHLTRCGLIERK